MGLLDAVQALIKAGFPDSTAVKIASGELPMDTASRMARASEQGFNPDDVFYHGTQANFTEFVPSEFGNVGGTSNKTGENPTSLQFQVFLI